MTLWFEFKETKLIPVSDRLRIINFNEGSNIWKDVISIFLSILYIFFRILVLWLCFTFVWFFYKILSYLTSFILPWVSSINDDWTSNGNVFSFLAYMSFIIWLLFASSWFIFSKFFLFFWWKITRDVKEY